MAVDDKLAILLQIARTCRIDGEELVPFVIAEP